MNYLFKTNKKAQSTSVIGFIVFVVVIIVGYAVTSFFTVDIFNTLNNDIQNDTTLNTTMKNTVSDLNTKLPRLLDGISIFMLLMFWVGGIVAAFYSDVNPIYFIVFIILMIILLVSAGIISNFWADITGDAAQAATVAKFPITNFIMDNYMLVFAVILLSSLITSFFKARAVI